MHKIKRDKDGKNFIQLFLALKWKNWAQSIKKAIIKEDKNKNSWYQIPKTRIVANEILSAPTIFLNKFDNPYCLNSKTMFSCLKTQTTTIEKEIIICDNINKFCIFFSINIKIYMKVKIWSYYTLLYQQYF